MFLCFDDVVFFQMEQLPPNGTIATTWFGKWNNLLIMEVPVKRMRGT